MLVLVIPMIITTIIIISSSLLLIRIEQKLGLLCKDVHKQGDIRIPCIGGFSLVIGLYIGITLLRLYKIISYEIFISFIVYLSISFIIGLIDDVIDLKSRWKIILGLLPVVPLMIFNVYVPRPWIPFLGYIRISSLYPLLMAGATTVYLNAANMFDTHNGTLPFITLSSIGFAVLLKIYTHAPLNDIAIPLLFSIAILSYLPFNIYPAKMFNGNTGAYVLGSLLAYTAIICRVEFYIVLSTFPMFINGFYYISSVKGFLQKEQVERPTYVDENGCIHPRIGKAPITFIRLLTLFSNTPLSEKELVIIVYTISFLSSLTAFIITIGLGFK
ncbi:Glycosyl transferase, family 4, conserved region [Ignisphaera aggregans DSM 17230]|uniref:Glycosyl transferase, family 4, conserved region n=1 Tax=Ignisphaera aggregans (strain DSM 17230 / JCM 13409 / AQ1.S1) TaxID=583356 RepID=E0SQM5_IGNAA|nr:Glycosyl transferase, family 4, conserved region [Ignisphaera aggregans DSM 17230]